jgi:hypothetical protein
MSAANDAPDASGEDRDALSRLENQLIHMEGIAQCLMLMGMSPYATDGAAGMSYLGGQLAEHYHAAREAFDEVFAAMKQKPAGR